MNLSEQKNIVDMRDAFFDKLYEFVKEDKDVLILTADHGAHGLKKIQQDYPNQYLNVGIAEQALIGIASGLARCGKKVYVYAINNFVSLRTLEQINIDVCAMNLDVNIVGVGAGFTYSTDGPTHHGIQDLCTMTNIPSLQVYNVTDDLSTAMLADISYESAGPKYFRIEKGVLPRTYSLDDDLTLGCKVISTQDSEVGVISTGFMTHVVDALVKKLNAAGNRISHLDITRVSPLPEEDIINFCKGKKIITVEENIASGGMGNKVFALLKRENHREKALNISIKDGFYFHFGDRELLHQKVALDSQSLLQKYKNLWNFRNV